MASRIARVRSVTSNDEATCPDIAGRPKFKTERRAYGAFAIASPVSSFVELNSQPRSRKTDSRSWRFDSTRASRDSSFLSGWSSVSRSSSAGCSRSCGGIGSGMIVRALAHLVRVAVQRNGPDVHQRHFFGVGCENALTETAVRVRRDLLPHRLAR